MDVSPRSVLFKHNIKMPLLLLLLSAAIQNALTQALLKFWGEIRIQGEGMFSPLSFSLLLSGVVLMVVNCLVVNTALKYYNQIDIATVYESLVIIAKMATGLILMNEVILYTWPEILGLCIT